MRALLFLLAVSTALGAQEAHEHEIGHVHFATSCASDVQPQFERGVALLHSFWYEESFRTFAAVSAADSDCAMAYWGQAMSLLHPLWAPPSPDDLKRGHDLSERAATLAHTPRERDYADAIATYYRELPTPSYRVPDRRVRTGDGENIPAKPRGSRGGDLLRAGDPRQWRRVRHDRRARPARGLDPLSPVPCRPVPSGAGALRDSRQ